MIKYFSILLLIALTGTLSTKLQASNDSTITKNHYLPIDLETSNVYVEKFSPLFIKDISKEDMEKLKYTDDEDEKVGNLHEFLDFYNGVLYRKLNEDIYNSIDKFELKDKVKPLFYRDFKEQIDTSYRYIIKCNFDAFDVFHNASTSSYLREYSDFNFYLYDKQENIRYKSVNTVDEFFNVYSYYLNLEKKDKLDRFTQSQLDKKLDKQIRTKTKESKSGDVSIAGKIVRGIAAFALSLIVLNTI